MKREVKILGEPLQPANMPAPALSADCGALVTFLGVVRGSEEGASIRAIDYEAFVPMALHQFGKVLDALEVRWPMVGSVRVIHSVGMVPAGQASLWVEVASPHRAEALEALGWFISEMKRVVPIWKRPLRSQGAV